MLKRINRFVRNLRQSSTSKKVENSPRSLLEKVTDVATIISAFGILVAIAQMLSQNAQFNDSFELSNKQFQYQLKQDSLQDKTDSIKDYRDSVKLQLAINEFAENKKNQKEEAKRNESQFEKNIQTLQELVRTNKQSNDYVVKSQRPYLGVEFFPFIFKKEVINFGFDLKNYGLRRPLLSQITYFFVDFDLKDFSNANFSALTIDYNYTNTPITKNSDINGSSFNFEDTQYYKSNNKPDKVFFVLDILYMDELTHDLLSQKFHFMILTNHGDMANRVFGCNPKEIKIIDKFIEQNKNKIKRY
jgi:hypothetical protein